MSKPYKDAYLDLFIFLKKPSDQPDYKHSVNHKVTRLFFISLLDISTAGICILLLSALSNLGLFSMENNKLIELLKTMPKSTVILTFIIGMPLLEEIIFRMYLRYRTNYLLQFFLLLFYVAGKKNKVHIENRIKRIWYKQYKYIFYFSAVLFGFMHIYNYNVDYKTLLLFPLITAPQIFSGIFAGYLRVRYNLIWGYFLHVIHNMLLILPFLFMGDSNDLPDNNTGDYFIQTDESFKNETIGLGKMYKDSLYFRKTKLRNIIAFVNYTDTFLIKTNNNKELNRELNLAYKNKSDSTFIDRKVINEHLMDLYKYKMKWESRSINCWNLIIEDSLKLISHSSDPLNSSTINFTNDSVKINNGQLGWIVHAIQISKSKRVFMKSNKEGNYNIEINIADTINLKNQLASIYGIKLVDTLADVKYLVIDFENNK